MAVHENSHPKAGQTVRIKFAGNGHPQVEGLEHDFRVEDYWDKISGTSWMTSDGNPAAMVYAMRTGLSGLPIDDEVVYGKIGSFGHMIHASEILDS